MICISTELEFLYITPGAYYLLNHKSGKITQDLPVILDIYYLNQVLYNTRETMFQLCLIKGDKGR